MSNPIQLTEEEVQKIKSLQEKYNTVTGKLGQLKVEQINLETQIGRLQKLEEDFTKEYLETQLEETTFASEITKKYGTGEINLETGMFTPDNATV